MPTFRLNQFVDVLHKTSSQSDFDYEPERWPVLCHAWAEIKPKKAEEQISGEQVSDVVQERAVIRYRDGIMSGMKLRSSKKCWDINTVADMAGQREYLELGVTECPMISN